MLLLFLAISLLCFGKILTFASAVEQIALHEKDLTSSEELSTTPVPSLIRQCSVMNVLNTAELQHVNFAVRHLKFVGKCIQPIATDLVAPIYTYIQLSWRLDLIQ
ncbi:hypothetical protein BJV82DRAFT_582669 [Fennellomyces sp. T-0311]|nr:hypothetical protein BJV82DRAFT_582669 [Fennellomyces sp. T-0311]